MVRPTSKPALTKAPRKEHPVAPAEPVVVEEKTASKPDASAGERVARLSIDLPYELHQAVKVAAVQRGTSMRSATIEALEWWLKNG